MDINEKLKRAYRKYEENFSTGIKLGDVAKDYEVGKTKIIGIVESNNIEKDHILLLNLRNVYSLNLSKWKDDVVLSGGNDIQHLKNMQMVTFYQCMAQELYKIKYPTMITSYNLWTVVVALIHFVIFGWKREEEILFEFIKRNFGSSLLKSNTTSEKHVWFLLSLYLEYRNKTIERVNEKKSFVSALFKKKKTENALDYELGIYEDVLKKWNISNLEKIEELINKMIEYHSELVSKIGQLGEFTNFQYGFYPYEILFLMHIRKSKGLPNPTQFNSFLMNTVEAKLTFKDFEPYPEFDPLVRIVDDFYKKNYSDYIPNKVDKLFE
ncbi:hypothetical protein [Flavobacterium tyrosinilyticum]|uniref:hypothetical protein n=1 Tax=Flavobacterium tyrosinilyticum TaxID=1658740 RepID=UPI00202EF9F6|nr:hypothetical protein [Flavobacterium tyrosinilyticum]MCM0665622.1 hypothetical protein [Flavobacterium tyrosinilyticum]